MDLAFPWCDAREETRRLFLLASIRCLQNVQKWAVSSVPNQTNKGVVFAAKRPNILFVMWNEKIFAELIDIVFQCVGSKESDWWSEIRCCCDNFKICHLKSAAVTEFTVISHQHKLWTCFWIPKISRKSSQTFVSNTEKIARLIGEEVRYIHTYFLFSR